MITQSEDLEVRLTQSLPANLINADTLHLLHKLARHINGLGKLDEQSGEVFLDERAFRSMLSDFQEYLPPHFEDAYINRMKAHPENRLDGRTLKPIKWHELAASVPVLKAYPHAPSQVAALASATSLDDLRTRLQELAPELDDQIFDPSTFKATFEQALKGLAVEPQSAEAFDPQISIGNVWNCFVSHWGWWGGALAVAAIIAIGTALGIFGSWSVIVGSIVIGVVSGYLLAALIGLGGVAGVLLSCILG